VVLKAGCVIKGKICMSERKIVKTVIAMEKNIIYLIMKTLLVKKEKTPLPERTLTLHCMYIGYCLLQVKDF